MKTYSNEQPETYQVIGKTLRIHWNIQEVTKEGMDGTETVWEADEALCDKGDSRDKLIEKIIGSVYSTGAEIAAINNAADKPEAHAEYQAFRQEAKDLADGWLNKE